MQLSRLLPAILILGVAALPNVFAQTRLFEPTTTPRIWGFMPKPGDDGLPNIVIPERCKTVGTLSRDCLRIMGIEQIEVRQPQIGAGPGNNCPSKDDIRDIVREEVGEPRQTPAIQALPAWKRMLVAGENTRPTGDERRDFEKRDKELEKASRIAPAEAKKTFEDIRKENKQNFKECSNPNTAIRDQFCGVYQ